MNQTEKSSKKRNSFSGSLGFVLAAAGSAVGLGNIWRFPYLAAKDGGGLFLVMYIVLALTFGFTLLTTEIAIGRKTKQSPLTAFSKLKAKWGFIGVLECLVPVLILPYYCVIGGWVVKYCLTFLSGDGTLAAESGYFSAFTAEVGEPVIMMLIFLLMVVVIVVGGVNRGIEASSKIMMPLLLLLIAGISLFSLTMSYTDADGVTRTGMEGLSIYLVPDFEGLTFKSFFTVLMDAVGQLFFSLSVAMGIMITYGSYVKDDVNMIKSINQIEICDTVVAFLAGVMIIPAVYVFMGRSGMEASGPGLMFVSLPQVFLEMGSAGTLIGILFFIMVLFAAVTSGVSLMETVVSSIMDRFHLSRAKALLAASVLTVVVGIAVCFGYNIWKFDYVLPNGTHAQILDILDYISNNAIMPVAAIALCILVGWVVKPKTVTDEIQKNGEKFGRKKLYVVMIKYVVPVLLFVLFLKAVGILTVL